jgi:hypothetical protein
MLPDDIAESHTYLTKLLETCAQLPFYDIARTLRHAFEHERKKGHAALVAFMHRLPTYVERHLSLDMQKQLNASTGLLYSLRSTLRMLTARPENWPFWGSEDLPVLLDRKRVLQEQGANLDIPATPDTKEIRHSLAKIETIIIALDLTEQAGGLAVSASELDQKSGSGSSVIDFGISICPLTGLSTKGKAKLDLEGECFFYRFKPIGIASFTPESLEEALSLISAGKKPLQDWAGLCRQADELGQGVVLVDGWPEDEHDAIPKTFEEKRLHFLRLLCEAGGNEHRERTINTLEDFPMAFATDAE